MQTTEFHSPQNLPAIRYMYTYNRQIKVYQNFLRAYNYIRMAILYRTTKFKSANIFARADSRRSAKFYGYAVYPDSP